MALLDGLDHAVRVEGVGDRAAELVVYPCGDAVGGHERRVHLHLVLRVAVLGSLVPVVLVFAFLGGFGVEFCGEGVLGAGWGFGWGRGGLGRQGGETRGVEWVIEMVWIGDLG